MELSKYGAIMKAIVKKKQSGFTLIELMTVIVIMSIGLAIGYPSFTRLLGEQRLYSVTRELAGEIRLIQQRAMAGEGTMPKIMINEEPPFYDVLDGTVVQKKVELPEGIKFGEGGYFGASHTIKFGFTGSPSYSGEITLENQYGSQYSIIIKTATGRVRIEKGE